MATMCGDCGELFVSAVVCRMHRERKRCLDARELISRGFVNHGAAWAMDGTGRPIFDEKK
jgi:hypothetical protein